MERLKNREETYLPAFPLTPRAAQSFSLTVVKTLS